MINRLDFFNIRFGPLKNSASKPLFIIILVHKKLIYGFIVKTIKIFCFNGMNNIKG